jgi:hypothetical protein
MICAVCFGDPASLLVHGYNYGILTLLGIVVLVLMSLGMFFFNIYKRTKKTV